LGIAESAGAPLRPAPTRAGVLPRLHGEVHSQLAVQAIVGFLVLAPEQVEARAQGVALSLPESPLGRPDQLFTGLQRPLGLLRPSLVQVPARQSEMDSSILEAGFALQILFRKMGILERFPVSRRAKESASRPLK